MMFNRKQRDGLGIGLHDLEKKSPRRSDEQDAPEPERRFDSAREARSPNLEEQHPSQAEGERRE
jgi:hypothetical protein